MCVVFRSAKERAFAERKTTIAGGERLYLTRQKVRGFRAGLTPPRSEVSSRTTRGIRNGRRHLPAESLSVVKPAC